MAKISTYPLDGSVNIGDKVIGTDVNDNNATKNFTLGDIISLPGSATYVPYTGAIADVNLGVHNLTATNLYATLFQGPVANLTTVNSTDVVVSNILETPYIKMPFNSLSLYNSSNQPSGLTVTGNNVTIGDIGGSGNGTFIQVFDGTSAISIISNEVYFTGAISVDNSFGNPGDILFSQGVGLPAQWGSLNNAQWNLTGNAGINPNDFIGTTDLKDFTVKTNNQLALVVEGSNQQVTAHANFFVKKALGQTPTIQIIETGLNGGIMSFLVDSISHFPEIHMGGVVAGQFKYAKIKMANVTDDKTYQLPMMFGSSGTFAMSINNVTADTYGDISIPLWNLTGNAGTNTAVNFIGTTDNVDFVVKTNNSLHATFVTSDRSTEFFGDIISRGPRKIEVQDTQQVFARMTLSSQPAIEMSNPGGNGTVSIYTNNITSPQAILQLPDALSKTLAVNVSGHDADQNGIVTFGGYTGVVDLNPIGGPVLNFADGILMSVS